MQTAAVRGPVLADYLRVVRRRWWIVALTVALITACALTFSSRQQRLYTASADVLLSHQALPTNTSATATPSYQMLQSARDAATQARVAHTLPVIANTAAAAAVPGIGTLQLYGQSSVSADPNSDILTFSVIDASPSDAVKLVNEWADQYTAYSAQLQTAGFERAIAKVVSSIATVRTEINAATRRGASAGPVRQNELADLQNTEQSLRAAEAVITSNTVVVQRATGATQTQPRTIRNASLGIMLGLLIGLGLAFVVQAFDTRVRSGDEGAQLLGLPLLGRLPAPSRALSKRNRLATLDPDSGAAAEAYNKLRINLEFANLECKARTIMVTSSVEKEGKSTTVGNLAVALARAGRRVVLVDLDLRRPMIGEFFGLDQMPGVTDVALGHVALNEALAQIVLTSGASPLGKGNGNGNGHDALIHGLLHVLPAGQSLPANPDAFLSTTALAVILQHLRTVADVILVDTPPLVVLSDAMTVSANIDGIVVVVHAELARKQMLRELRHLLDLSPAPALGWVLTAAEHVDGQYGYGSYGGGYAAPATKATPTRDGASTPTAGGAA